MQRPPVVVVRATSRAERDQPTTHAAGFFHYAGQSQSRDPRGDEPDLLQGDWQRPDGDLAVQPQAAFKCNGTCIPLCIMELILIGRCGMDTQNYTDASPPTDKREMLVKRALHRNALNPVMKHKTQTLTVKKAWKPANGVYEIVIEEGLLTEERLKELLKPENMIGPKNGKNISIKQSHQEAVCQAASLLFDRTTSWIN